MFIQVHVLRLRTFYADKETRCQTFRIDNHRVQEEIDQLIYVVIRSASLQSSQQHGHNALRVLLECYQRNVSDYCLKWLEARGIVNFGWDRLLLYNGQNTRELSRARQLCCVRSQEGFKEANEPRDASFLRPARRLKKEGKRDW